jgi:hypothetical protein
MALEVLGCGFLFACLGVLFIEDSSLTLFPNALARVKTPCDIEVLYVPATALAVQLLFDNVFFRLQIELLSGESLSQETVEPGDALSDVFDPPVSGESFKKLAISPGDSSKSDIFGAQVSMLNVFNVVYVTSPERMQYGNTIGITDAAELRRKT